MFALQVPAWRLEGQARSVLKRGIDGKHRGLARPSPRRPAPRRRPEPGWAQPRCGQCHLEASAGPSPARPQRLTGSALKPAGRLDPSTSTQEPGAPMMPGIVPQLPGTREGRPRSEGGSPFILRPAFDSARRTPAHGRFSSGRREAWVLRRARGRRTAHQDVCCRRAPPCRRQGVLTCGVPPFLCLTHHATLNQLQIKLSHREIICFKHKRFFFSHR